MKEDDYKGILESLFPVGQERWIKVKYKDFDWCVKNMRISAKDPPMPVPGFEVTALGVRDEYYPQLSAIMDLKAEIIGTLYGLPNFPEGMLEIINEIFKRKMDEVKEYTIKKVPE